MSAHNFICDLGSTLLLKKKAPTLNMATAIASGRNIRKREIPEAFIAVSSNFSARLPNEMSELSSIARGSASGITEAVA